MSETLRLRQLAILVDDPAPAVEAVCRAFGLRVAFDDPGLAQHRMQNRIIPVGDVFLEVAAPLTSEGPAARFLQKGGPGGYVVIVQTDDLPAAERRIARHGVAVAHRIDKPEATELQLAHRDVGGCLLSIDAARPPDSWLFAGPDWREHVRTDRVRALAGVDIACGDPAAVARRWASVLGRGVESAGEGALRLSLDDGGDVRFVGADGAPDRMVAIRLRAARPDAAGLSVQVGSLTIRAVD